MTDFPNPTTYTIRINYHDFDGNFVEAKEVYVTDDDLTEPQVRVLDAIIAQGTDIPVYENCLTSSERHSVTKQANGRLLCECCVQLLDITRTERRMRQRRQREATP